MFRHLSCNVCHWWTTKISEKWILKQNCFCCIGETAIQKYFDTITYYSIYTYIPCIFKKSIQIIWLNTKINTIQHIHTMALIINITTSVIKFHYNLSCYILLTEIIHLYNIKCQHSARTAPTLSICSEDYIYIIG